MGNSCTVAEENSHEIQLNQTIKIEPESKRQVKLNPQIESEQINTRNTYYRVETTSMRQNTDASLEQYLNRMIYPAPGTHGMPC